VNIIKKTVIRNIKTIFDSFAKQNGFTFLKPLVLIRIQNDILHIISFDLSSGGFTCDVAVQPLFVPSNNLVLSFGNRISRLGVCMPERWTYGDSEASIIKGLEEIRDLMTENGLDWFKCLNHPEGIVEYIESGKVADPQYIVAFAPHLRWLYLGFCYLWLGEMVKARMSLEELEKHLQNDQRPWVVQLRQLGKDYSIMAEQNPKQIPEKLDENMFLTKKQIGVK